MRQLPRKNSIRTIAFNVSGKCINTYSISDAARLTNHSVPTVKRILNGTQKTTRDGWAYKIVDLTNKDDSSSDANLRPLWLSLEEIESLHLLMKKDIQDAALCKPYDPDYRWPLYDKVAKIIGNCNDSHNEYEYWRDWDEKNREDWK